MHPFSASSRLTTFSPFYHDISGAFERPPLSVRHVSFGFYVTAYTYFLTPFSHVTCEQTPQLM
jgi:hypothetical protein